MEIYTLFGFIAMTLGIFKIQMPTSLYGGMIGAVIIWLALFLLQAIGMYTMAKKQNVEKRWMAFIPFVNFLFMGKLAGECNIFGQKVRRAGLFAMIAQIVATLLCVLEIVAITYLYTVEGAPSFDQFNQPYWSNVQGTSLTLVKVRDIVALILPIAQMIYEIMTFIIVVALYKKYVPNSYFALAVLSLFVPLSRYIILFVIRNRPLVDFEAFMRKKQEEFLRQRGYTQTPPYSNPYNPNGQTPPAPPEEPFSEFGENEKNNNDTDDEFFS